MNILLLGMPLLEAALESRGHRCLSVSWQSQARIQVSHPLTVRNLWDRLERMGFAPDVAFYQDDGNLPSLMDPEALPCPAIYHSIDTYCNPWHVCYQGRRILFRNYLE